MFVYLWSVIVAFQWFTSFCYLIEFDNINEESILCLWKWIIYEESRQYNRRQKYFKISWQAIQKLNIGMVLKNKIWYTLYQLTRSFLRKKTLHNLQGFRLCYGLKSDHNQYKLKNWKIHILYDIWSFWVLKSINRKRERL